MTELAIAAAEFRAQTWTETAAFPSTSHRSQGKHESPSQ